MSNLSGGCLCGSVSFSVKNEFKRFYQCHCKQCQQLTGSAFASNLFTSPDNIQWDKGLEDVTHYAHPDREFSKSFCKHCGSALPVVTKSKRFLLVPAGSINGQPNIELTANIFTSEKACWLEQGKIVPSFDGFPKG